MNDIFEMPDDARTWIYQADRILSNAEVDEITRSATQFVASWTSHGATMDAFIRIFHNRFLIIAADEKKALASGCGIDKSVRFVKDTGEKYGVEFFNRNLVAYRQEGEIKQSPLHVFWAMKKAGIIDNETIVFDHTVKNIGELRDKWEAPFSSTWHNEMWLR